ncbi:MAG: hypothetical protein ACKOWF_17255 [Chloroflexota bacterium]
MDPARFDALARTLPISRSRRSLLAAAALLLPSFAADAEARRRRKDKQRSRPKPDPKPDPSTKPRQKPRDVMLGGKCRLIDNCREGTCQRNICTCGGGERRCSDRCIPLEACCASADCAPPLSGIPCSAPYCKPDYTCGLAPLPAGVPCGPSDSSICDGMGHCVAKPCATVNDCPRPSGYCLGVACESGLCTAAPRRFRERLPVQVAGDCLAAVCDGSGGVTHVADDADEPPGANPCVALGCETGSVISLPRPAGTPCGPGRTCDGAGACA